MEEYLTDCSWIIYSVIEKENQKKKCGFRQESPDIFLKFRDLSSLSLNIVEFRRHAKKLQCYNVQIHSLVKKIN